MLKAILLTGYLISVPTAMLAPAVFMHGPAIDKPKLETAKRPAQRQRVLRGTLPSDAVALWCALPADGCGIAVQSKKGSGLEGGASVRLASE